LTTLFAIGPVFSQDLERVFKENPVKINGGLSARQIFFATDNELNTRQTFMYNISGQMNVAFLQWSFPFSFNYSNQDLNFNRPTAQPFNQFGMSPKYKWATGHFGWRSMTFSPYTLSGHLFLGAGMELKPTKNWEVAAMYGRLLKAIEYNGENTPAYKRLGAGLKVGHSYKGGRVALIIFNGWDDETSLAAPPDSILAPESNMVVSAQFEQKLFEKLSFTFDGARSAYTRDVRSEEAYVSNSSLFDAFILTPTLASTDFYGAMKSSLNYSLSGTTLGLNFERIDPGYKTLGAYYFNSDLQNVTVSASTQLFEKKMSVSTNIGRQKNNLDGSKASESNRWVGSLNLSGPIGEKLNLNGAYSNFTSFTVILPVDQQIAQISQINYDSLNFTQLSNSLNFGANYKLAANKKRTHTLTGSGTYQKVSSKNGEGTFVGGTEMYNASVSYNYNFVPLKLNVRSSVNGNTTIVPENPSQLFGGSIGVSKPLVKELVKGTLNFNYNETFAAGVSNGNIIVTRLSLSTSIKKKHNLSFSANYISRNQDSGRGNDFTGSISYSYSFNLLKKKSNDSNQQGDSENKGKK
jgi:hypothetical protein